ncbi:hypothetical protein IDJ75_08500 [Mucilaginibacter rigui]|uniref:Uncharacterized protein n=1 Tax=Mucilaginibacter rigui TaxID=534635 RepID=A0ABR7X405_9SPHI|nr:hypothetical protein [Mucilaginibacter rigui]MBD1385316.1 hypothetical protein [Mucilaginibacter rigui]
MKKTTFIFLAIIIALFSACKKENTTVITPEKPDNFFTYDTDSHTVVSSSRSVDMFNHPVIIFKAEDKWSLTLTFKNYPTASGTYQLSSDIEDNEFRLSGSDKYGASFNYQRSPIPVEIKVNASGKISTTIPEIFAGAASPSNSYKLTATLYEK